MLFLRLMEPTFVARPSIVRSPFARRLCAAGAECTQHQAGKKPGDAGNVVFGMVRPALNRFAGATRLPFGIVRVVLVDAIDDFLQSQMGHGALSKRSKVSVFDSVVDCNTVNSRGVCRCTIEPEPTAEKTLLGWATKATWSLYGSLHWLL